MQEIIYKIVKTFEHEGRNCIVIEMDLTEKARKIMKKIGVKKLLKMYPYCNGYVETRDARDLYDIPVECVELTFKDKLELLKKSNELKSINGILFWAMPEIDFVGFDTAHSWNDLNPYSKKSDYVEQKCKELAEELNRVEKTGLFNLIKYKFKKWLLGGNEWKKKN